MPYKNTSVCCVVSYCLTVFFTHYALQVFQKELGKRTVSVQALKRSARELIESSHDDSSWVKVQMQELSTRWETVCNLSVSKQARLEQALCQVLWSCSSWTDGKLSLWAWCKWYFLFRLRSFTRLFTYCWSGSQRQSRVYVSMAACLMTRRLCGYLLNNTRQVTQKPKI